MTTSVLQQAKSVMQSELSAIMLMKDKLNQNFEKAIEVILEMSGRVVVIGMGKSGIIGQKIAATMASTGTFAFFIHPGEAFHGDLGMIRPIDVALLISNSGETEEIIRIIPFLQEQNNKIIAMTGNLNSTLAKHADIVLDVGVVQEACPNNLAPTSSTTCTLVMGDALSVVLSSQKNFQPKDFARFHPGGSLGRRLLTRVSDAMHRNLPTCNPDANFKEIVYSISHGSLGLTLVMSGKDLQGIITDGDIRRAFDQDNFSQLVAQDLMSVSPKYISADARLAEAEDLMISEKISGLVVKDKTGEVVGIIKNHDMNA